MTVVAIDGPAGSGKSTVARRVAEALGIEVLDTGAMYRAVTWAVLHAGADPGDGDAASTAAGSIVLRMDGDRVFVDDHDVTQAIRGPEVSGVVSEVSAHPGVRAALRELQRVWMAGRPGGVVEGRDIGTVVFPDADVKVFLVASPEVRAARRAGESGVERHEAAANIADRDRIDSSRADSPLIEAADAVRIDTSDLTIDQVVDRVVAIARQEASS